MLISQQLLFSSSRHQIKKTDNDIEIEEFIKKEIAHGNIDLARQVIAENFGEKQFRLKKTYSIKFLLLLCLQIKLTFFIMAIQFYFVQNLINQILNVDI